MKNILVPFDFSAASMNALKTAFNVSIKSPTTIHVLHSIHLPEAHDNAITPVTIWEASFLDELKNKTEKDFHGVIDKFKKEGPKLVYQLRNGSVAETILNYIREQNIDMVIIGSHGKGNDTYFLGSNTQRIVRRSTVPVLVIKDEMKGVVKRITFPIDFTDRAEDGLLEEVTALQNFFNAQLDIVFINTPDSFSSDPVTHEMLYALVQRYDIKNYTLNIHNHFTVEEGILSFSRMNDADMIALGTHGRRGINHIISGSITENVSKDASIPVWSYSIKNDDKNRIILA
jgi:nucleotide-binding universal stress UspA family protein